MPAAATHNPSCSASSQDRAAHTSQLAARFLDIVADAGPQLHLRLQKLGMDLIGQHGLA